MARTGRELTPEEVAWLRGDDLRTPRARTGTGRPTRRAVLAGAVGVGSMATGAAALGSLDWPSALASARAGTGPDGGQRAGAADGPHATCVDESSLLATGRIGRAALVYEVDRRPRTMAFDPGFHRQLVAWLDDWEANGSRPGTRQVWSYGAHVAKDGCRSWHAAGRAVDIAHLTDGDEVLVSARTDLWHTVGAARRRELERGYWALAASLHLHFAYVLTHHFDALHANHLHVDNGASGAGRSRVDATSRVQAQAVQGICRALWGVDGEVTGSWRDARRMAAGVQRSLRLGAVDTQAGWQGFLRASMRRR